jgi:hypothetical protein
LPESERNILPTGDPEQDLNPYKYIWIYTYQERIIQNPAIHENFQHIEDNFELENLLDQQHQEKRRGRPQGSKNLKESWKNTIASEWKPPRKFCPVQDPDCIASRTRSRQHVDSILDVHLNNNRDTHKPSSNFNQWTVDDTEVCHRRKILSCAYPYFSGQN